MSSVKRRRWAKWPCCITLASSGGCGWARRGWMKERTAVPCLISLSHQGQDFLSGSVVLPATEDSPIQAHNVPVSPDNTSCLRWLQPSQGYTIFHSSQQWPVCLHPPYGYYGPQYWHTSLIIQRDEGKWRRRREGKWTNADILSNISCRGVFAHLRSSDRYCWDSRRMWSILTGFTGTQSRLRSGCALGDSQLTSVLTPSPPFSSCWKWFAEILQRHKQN